MKENTGNQTEIEAKLQALELENKRLASKVRETDLISKLLGLIIDFNDERLFFDELLSLVNNTFQIGFSAITELYGQTLHCISYATVSGKPINNPQLTLSEEILIRLSDQTSCFFALPYKQSGIILPELPFEPDSCLIIPLRSKQEGYNYLVFLQENTPDDFNENKVLLEKTAQAILVKLAEAKSKESEFKLNTFVEHVADSLFIHDFSGQLIDLNTQTCTSLGYSREELLSMNILDLDTGSDRVKAQEFWKQMEPDRRYQINGSWRSKNGTEFPVEGNLGCYDLNGKRMFMGMVRDVSRRKQNEEIIHESNLLIQNIIDNSPSLIYVMTIDGRVQMVNKQFEMLFKQKKTNLIGLFRQDFMSAKDAEEHHQNDLKVAELKQAITFEEQNHEADGLHYYLTQKFPIFDSEQNVISIGGISTDITATKKAERIRLESEEKFRLAFLTSPDSININRLSDGLYVEVNDSFTVITGYSRAEIIGKTSIELNIWANPEERNTLTNNLLRFGKVENMHAQYRMKDGRIIDGLMSASVIQLNQEAHIISITRDITEINQAKASLMESEKRYRDLFDKNHAVMLLVDPENGNILGANPAATEFYGWTNEELTDMNLKEINTLPPDELKANIQLADRNVQRHFTFSHRLANQSVRHVEVYTTPIIVGQKKVLYSIIHDVTDRKEAETALLKEKNLLGTIIENIPVMLTRYDPTSNMLYLNKEFTEKVGWNTKDLETINLLEEVYPDPDYRQKAIEYMQKATIEWKEFELRTRSGETIESEWCNINLEDGTQIGIGIDITNEKKTANAILRANEELTKINRIIHISSSTIDLNDLLDKVLDQAIEITNLEGGTICLFESGNTLKKTCYQPKSTESFCGLSGISIQAGNCLCGNCAFTGKPLVLPDRASVLKYSSTEILQKEKINFHAAYPFMSKGVCLGILCVYTHTEQKPDERNLRLLETLTKEVALAIENALLFQELEQRVNDRTSELEQANKELEEVNDLFIGREFRIIELKEEIDQLKRKPNG